MLTEDNVEQVTERFFELLGKKTQTAADEAEFSSIVQMLGLTPEDLRDLAAQCRRRAIYLNNT